MGVSSTMCFYCGFRAGIKTDSKSNLVCNQCLTTRPQRNLKRHIGRNDPCSCGSGRKFKACCMRSSNR